MKKETILIFITLISTGFMTSCPGTSPIDQGTYYYVTYDGNGSDGGTVPSDSTAYIVGQEVTVQDTGTMTRSSHSFTGWNSESDGTGISYTGGSSFLMPSSDVALYARRMLINGILDTSFSCDGIALYDRPVTGGNNYDYAFDMEIDGSGNIFITGESESDNAWESDFIILKYTDSGSLDESFGTGGVLIIDDPAQVGGGSNTVNDMILDTSGNILATGYCSIPNNDFDMGILKITASGTWDTDFGTDGGVLIDGTAGKTGGTDEGRSIALDSANNIYITGNSENGMDFDMVIWKFDSNGQAVTGFGTNGSVVHDNAAGGNGDDSGYCIVIDSEDCI